MIFCLEETVKQKNIDKSVFWASSPCNDAAISEKNGYFSKYRSQYSVSSFDSGASGLGFSFVLGGVAF